MEPAFETKRLRVYHLLGVTPDDDDEPVDVYVALRSDDAFRGVVATATLWERGGKWAIDWLQVWSQLQREEFGTELYEGLLENVEGLLNGTPGTLEGAAFLAAMDARKRLS